MSSPSTSPLSLSPAQPPTAEERDSMERSTFKPNPMDTAMTEAAKSFRDKLINGGFSSMESLVSYEEICAANPTPVFTMLEDPITGVKVKVPEVERKNIIWYKMSIDKSRQWNCQLILLPAEYMEGGSFYYYLHKNLKAAAAVAVNELFGGKLGLDQLDLAGLESEAKVSGYHADNIAPAIMGGFILIKSYEPLELKPLIFPEKSELFFIFVDPEFEAPTKKMRGALPTEIGMLHHVWNCSQAGALVASILEGDAVGLGKAMSSDKIVEPKRAPLIPGMEVLNMIELRRKNLKR